MELPSHTHNSARLSRIVQFPIKGFVVLQRNVMRTLLLNGAKHIRSHILWIDKTSKDDQTVYRHFGHSIISTHAIIPANFICGVQYSLVAAFGLGGYAAS